MDTLCVFCLQRSGGLENLSAVQRAVKNTEILPESVRTPLSSNYLVEFMRFDRREGRAAFIGELELKDSAGEVFTIHTPVQVWDLGRASASESGPKHTNRSLAISSSSTTAMAS